MATDPNRRAAWCKVCDVWAQTWPDKLESDGKPALYLERCLHCDTVLSTSEKPRP